MSPAPHPLADLPPGTPVFVTLATGRPLQSRTAERPRPDGRGWAVRVRGLRGAVALDRVEVIPADPETGKPEDPRRRARDEGRAAHAAGVSVASNPYTRARERSLAAAWAAGWFDAKARHHAAQREEAHA